MRFVTIVTHSGLRIHVPSCWTVCTFHGKTYRI